MMETDKSLLSPRLAGLQEGLLAGRPAALESFWEEIADHGSPLVELIQDSDQALVTFVWRATGETAKVEVVSNLSGKMGEHEPMFHLTGTDLWYRTYGLPADTRETYQISVDGQDLTDPLNPDRFLFPLDEDSSIGGWESSLFELPSAPSQPWSSPRPGVPTGQVTKYSLSSAILGNDYPVWIYTPPGYSAEGEPYGFLLMLDGWFYVDLMPAPTILDNLLAEGRLPPLVAILVGSLYYGDVRKRDYGCYPAYIDFLTQELLPWARQKVHLTDDPNQAGIVGASRGGLMAAYIALNQSNLFGNVLSQSGSFGWKPAGDREGDWLARQYATNPTLPLRFYLEAGLFETDILMVDGFSIDLLASNRHLRDVLQARGYPVPYHEFSGGHSTVIWRGTLAEGLLALFGKQADRNRKQDH